LVGSFAKGALVLLLGLNAFGLSEGAHAEETTKMAAEKATEETVGKAIANQIVCYPQTCFPTTPMAQIKDPNYIYPRPPDWLSFAINRQYTSPSAILDLTVIDPSTPLSASFQVQDFMANRKGPYGLYSPLVVERMQTLVNELKKPVRITSGYRSPGYNRKVKDAAKWSRHTYGDAVDFSVAETRIADLTAYCKKYGADFTLTYPKHIHCDWRKSKLEPAFFGSQPLHLEDTFLQSLPSQPPEEAVWNVTETSGQRQVAVHLMLDLDEEEGTPTHQWTVRLPSGRVLTSSDTLLSLPKQPGTYDIQVLVGGSIQLTKIFKW